LSFKFWLNLRPEPLTPFFEKILIAFIILSLVIFISAHFFKKKDKKLFYAKFLDSMASLCLANFFIGLLLLFFTYEMIPFLSSRFWFLFWATGLLIWLYFIIKKIVALPKISKQIKEEREFKKYIP